MTNEIWVGATCVLFFFSLWVYIDISEIKFERKRNSKLIKGTFFSDLKCFLGWHKDGYYPDGKTRHCIRCGKKF